MREEWIDRWKGLLIILVVVGHVAGSVAAMAPHKDWATWHYIYKSIYFFHMPAFFFISGMLFRRDIELKEFAIKRVKRLLVPYFIFGLFSIIIFMVFEGAFRIETQGNAFWDSRGKDAWWVPLASLLYGAPLPGTDGFRCNSVLWFLPCLFSSQMILAIIRKLPKFGIMAIGLFAPIIYVALNKAECPSLPWGLRSMAKYFFFVALGVVWRQVVSMDRKWWRVIVALFIYLGAAYFVSYSTGMYKDYLWWLLITAMGTLGIVVSAGIAKIVSLRVLVICGEISIGIMMLHKLPLLAMQMKVWIVKQMITSGGLSAAIGAIGLIAVALGISLIASLMIKKIAPWALGMNRK